MNLDRFTKNPLLVLGLAPGASHMDVERTGQKLLGLLSIGAESAKSYQTPWGPQPRDESLVRQALAQLKDPAVRLRAELWTLPAATGKSEASGQPKVAEELVVAQKHAVEENLLGRLAFRAVGWRWPCT